MVSMTIKNVTKVDGGIYTAKISNNVSDAKAEFTLAVRDKPDKPTGKILNYYFSKSVPASALFLPIKSYEIQNYRHPIKSNTTSPHVAGRLP